MCKKVVCFDLDDTLYKEIDFLKSGYRKVAELVATQYGCDARAIYDKLLKWYYIGENAFACMNEEYGFNNPIKEYLDVYRYHQPSIMLSEGVEVTLNELKRRGVIMGLITDGRTISQKNKIKVLGLDRFFDNNSIIISEEFGSGKTDERNFRYFMGAYPSCSYCYVGDNPMKDFLVPNRLCWQTIMLKDDGRNIHRQNGEQMANLPNVVINHFRELLDILE